MPTMTPPTERRAPLTVERARAAAATLEDVAAGRHPVGADGVPGAQAARLLALRKLGELLDETEGLAQEVGR